MEYNYESLLDERFQMLCQSLLTREYAGVQCLPVGMPDGGRDALAPGTTSKGTVIFQVKFARNPNKLKDPAQWVISAIARELKKIQQLQENNAERYIIMTNVPGTSHLNTGSIDRVQRHLDSTLAIPAQCWWRDDIDRRLDTHFDLKLKYPTLLSGADAIRLLWSLTGPGENQARRENAIRAYLAYHYQQDRTVRFKEVGLTSNSLFDLFIDVPAEPAPQRHQRIPSHYLQAAQRLAAFKVRHQFQSETDDSENAPETRTTYWAGHSISQLYVYMGKDHHMVNIGAAELFLDPGYMANTACIVLEGAPGQGKSTLAQYLMQVHRARLLEMADELQHLPSLYATSSLMMPIKLELRDIALWLNGLDPWGIEQGKAHNKPSTLEGALAAHIERYSGGVEFSVSDLLETLTSMPAMLVLDALDEVADLDDRKRVVEEVQAGILRLQQRNSGICAVVTSRPTAITNAPAFSRDRFSYMSLAPISHNLAMDYAKRWAEARSLEQKDTADLLDVLKRRLGAPHIAELAKNTMQLTILLTLISLRGPSLPDKRTALYDTYFDVFMNRESEKDASVRDNRELLIDLHRYLGYSLHAKAEARHSTGRITTQDLDTLIRDYLEREGRPPSLLPSLFGSVDRIFALVSRVQGTWEFEVQPLQEYFAARFLYDTAPPSPPGRERTGTKPDRFDGIAQNAYWFNVARFFAGCFQKGELLDLSDRMADLIQSQSTYTRVLSISLLQDWVFTQSVKATNTLLSRVFDRPGLRWAGSQLVCDVASSWGGSVNLTFPRDAEASHIVDIAWEVVRDGHRTQRVRETCEFLTRQPVRDYLFDKWWKELEAKSSTERSDWLEVGMWLNLLRRASPKQALEMADPGTQEGLGKRTSVLVRGGAFTGLLGEEVLLSGIRAMLDSPRSVADRRRDSEPLQLTWFSDPFIWLSLTKRRNESFYDQFEIVGYVQADMPRTQDSRDTPAARGESELRGLLKDVTTTPLTGAEMLGRWAALITIINRWFGRTLLENELAVMSGHIASPHDRGSGARELMDRTRSIVDRVRYARGQLNRADWWRAQVDNISDDHDRTLWLLASYTWASAPAFADLLPDFEMLTSTLTDSHKGELVRASAGRKVTRRGLGAS